MNYMFKFLIHPVLTLCKKLTKSHLHYLRFKVVAWRQVPITKTSIIEFSSLLYHLI